MRTRAERLLPRADTAGAAAGLAVNGPECGDPRAVIIGSGSLVLRRKVGSNEVETNAELGCTEPAWPRRQNTGPDLPCLRNAETPASWWRTGVDSGRYGGASRDRTALLPVLDDLRCSTPGLPSHRFHEILKEAIQVRSSSPAPRRNPSPATKGRPAHYRLFVESSVWEGRPRPAVTRLLLSDTGA